jgi:HAD superfamily hydrolase (TIGR01458 family)
MREYGFSVEPADVFTAILAAATRLRADGVRRVAPFVARESLADFVDFELEGGMSGSPAGARPDAVVVGDLGAEWTPGLLNEAFRYVLDGARLVALQRDRYWLGSTGLELDAGPYVAAIEYATGVGAVVCGKPSAEFYQAALEGLPQPAAMIGDDLWADVDGAQRAGLQGWLVQTGKFRADVLAKSGVVPDRLLASIADLAAL